ncbi:MAG TPA: YceH family protein [Bryobacteraceae bacterium]|nr:YceH family protein [Bryobacteraceae bacterium]
METLDAAEVRVLGSLIEKEATTPEYYPLSLNALINACNQKSNRDPVVEYDEDTVYDAATRLREKRFALLNTGSGRVNKYSQRISETLNLGRRELAVLCTLLLRGAQTLGEIKDRSERMFNFADLAETESVLEKLAEWPGGALVKKLARQAGQKEARYAHLLSGEPVWETTAASESHSVPAPTKVAQLESDLQRLRSDFEELKQRFEALEQQLR